VPCGVFVDVSQLSRHPCFRCGPQLSAVTDLFHNPRWHGVIQQTHTSTEASIKVRFCVVQVSGAQIWMHSTASGLTSTFLVSSLTIPRSILSQGRYGTCSISCGTWTSTDATEFPMFAAHPSRYCISSCARWPLCHSSDTLTSAAVA
jgi:hypothetical protein